MNTHSFSPNRGMFVKMRQFPSRALLLDSGGGDQSRARVQGRDLCRAQVQRQPRRRRAGLRSPAHGFGLGHRYRTTALPEGIPRFGRCAPSLGMTGGVATVPVDGPGPRSTAPVDGTGTGCRPGPLVLTLSDTSPATPSPERDRRVREFLRTWNDRRRRRKPESEDGRRPLSPTRRRCGSGSSALDRFVHGLPRGWPEPRMPTGRPDRRGSSVSGEPRRRAPVLPRPPGARVRGLRICWRKRQKRCSSWSSYHRPNRRRRPLSGVAQRPAAGRRSP